MVNYSPGPDHIERSIPEAEIFSVLLTNLRFEHIDAAVSGMIEDEREPKTIRNVFTLLRTMLTGKKAGSAARYGMRTGLLSWRGGRLSS